MPSEFSVLVSKREVSFLHLKAIRAVCRDARTFLVYNTNQSNHRGRNSCPKHDDFSLISVITRQISRIAKDLRDIICLQDFLELSRRGRDGAWQGFVSRSWHAMGCVLFTSYSDDSVLQNLMGRFSLEFWYPLSFLSPRASLEHREGGSMRNPWHEMYALVESPAARVRIV